MFRTTALVHLGVLVAWAAPWSCQTYTASDAGSVTPTSGSSGGGRFFGDASVPVVYSADAGSGLAAGSDGGVTVGSSAAFTSNFVFMSNADEGTVSRIVLPSDGGAPVEEARYFCIVPLDNHGVEPCVAAYGCIPSDAGTLTDIWHFQHASYVVNPDYTYCVPFNDGGYRLPVVVNFNDGGYSRVSNYNDGGYDLRIDAGFNDGGYSVTTDAGYFNDGGYSASTPFNDGGYSKSIAYNDGGYDLTYLQPFIDGGYNASTPFNDGGYNKSIAYNDGGYDLTYPRPFNDGGYNASTPFNDGGYNVTTDAGYFNDGGYNASTPFNDGGYNVTTDAGYFNDGGYNASTPFNDGGYSAVIDAGYFNDGGYVITMAFNDGGWAGFIDAGYFNDGGYSRVVDAGFNDGGYSIIVTFFDGGVLYHLDAGGIPVTLLDGGEYQAPVSFNDGGWFGLVDAGFSDGGYDNTTLAAFNDAGWIYDAGFKDGGYDLTVGASFNDGGYSKLVAYNDAGYDLTYSQPFNDAGYSKLVAYNDAGYDLTYSQPFNDAGYSKLVAYDDGGYNVTTDAGFFNDGGYNASTPFNDGGYNKSVAYNDGGYNVTTDAGYFNDGGYNASTPFNDAGYSASVPYNDAGYDRTYLAPFNDGGYSAVMDAGYFTDGGWSQDAGYNDGGWVFNTDAGYVDGGYCTNEAFADGGTPFNDGGNIDQLALANGADDQPSRTVVDRNGNVWVVLRATDGTNYFQSGITKIIDVDDNYTECVPRCAQRNGLLPNQVFTEGVPLNLSGGGTVTLKPPTVIAPGTSYATTYACQDTGHDHTGKIDTDAVNYDDCLSFSIPLGAPFPDPNADSNGATASLSFGRGTAISPNCNPSTSDCDVWVGMWNDAGWIRLSYNGSGLGSGVPYDVGTVINPGASPYGAAVDCAGVIWGTGNNAQGQDVLTATSTIAVSDPAYNVAVGAYTVLSNFAIVNDAGVTTLQYGIPKPPQNDHYGIASDIQERIWSAAGDQGAYASAFNAVDLFQLLGTSDGGIVGSTAWSSMLNLGWMTYNFSAIAPAPSNVPFSLTPPAGTFARGINVDKTGNVYVGMDVEPWQGGGQGIVSFYPNSAGTIPCILYDGGSCPGVQLNWAYELLDAGTHGGSVGVDIDAQGNPWLGNYGQPQGLAQRFNAANGALMSEVPVGNGTYSYSDFTGYALRYITLASAVYEHAISGCGVSPELTQWNSLGYTATVPAGTDMRFDVKVVDNLGSVILALAHDYEVCDSVTSPSSPTSCPRNADGSISLTGFGIPQGAYLVVYATMTPTVCGSSRGNAAAPTLYNLEAATTCSGD